jgi:hypothetical protein
MFLVPGLGDAALTAGHVFFETKRCSNVDNARKQPLVAIGVEVEECFAVCQRPSSARNSGRVSCKSSLPSLQILMDQTQIAGQTVEALHQAIEESYAKRLY